ncbi:MAG: hypothetical protein ACREF4_05025 [Gammaproteobacteria bacterium]
MSTDAVQVFTDNYEGNRHFLPFAHEINKKKFPGVRQSEDEMEPDNDVEVPEEDAGERNSDEDDREPIDIRCQTCGEVAEVMPPRGYQFMANADRSIDGDGEKVTFRCPECGATNSPRHHRVVRIEEASTAFHRAYRVGERRRVTVDDPAEAFSEVYSGPTTAPSPRAIEAICCFLQSYRKR